MAQRPDDLPDFQNPPVVEVVLGVQFSELRGYRTVHAGLLWERCFRREFPLVREQPPLDPTFETFGQPRQEPPKLQIMQVPGPQVPRLLFINHESTDLVQVQADRFVRNWRKIAQDNVYPRYERIRDSFFDEVKRVDDFFGAENIGRIEPNQCEVTYVNHIDLTPFGGAIRIDRIFRNWVGAASDSADQRADLPDFEDARFAARYVLKSPGGSPVGRLFAVAEPAIASSNTPIIRFSLTAKGAPAGGDYSAVGTFLDLGRRAIVRAFAALTTKEMHERWQRIR